MAEGTHQIVQGNLDRAAAAMAVADKQSLPIEPQFPRTPRGSAGYHPAARQPYAPAEADGLA